MIITNYKFHVRHVNHGILTRVDLTPSSRYSRFFSLILLDSANARAIVDTPRQVRGVATRGALPSEPPSTRLPSTRAGTRSCTSATVASSSSDPIPESAPRTGRGPARFLNVVTYTSAPIVGYFYCGCWIGADTRIDVSILSEIHVGRGICEGTNIDRPSTVPPHPV